MSEGGWTPEKLEGLTRLWGQGLSCVDIGTIIGMGKNAVIGKAHRLGLARKGRPWSAEEREHRKRIRKGLPSDFVRRPKRSKPKRSKKVLPPTLVAISKPTPGGLSILDLESHHCREVVGRGPDQLARYCGERARTRYDRHGKLVQDSFCLRHAGINYARHV